MSRAAAQALRALVAGAAEPSRLARGRQYSRRGLVGSLQVEPSRLTADVFGSRPEPYRVTVTCRGALQPVADDVMARFAAVGDVGLAVESAVADGVDVVPGSFSASCTCPDWEDPCKHAVAVLLRFADHVQSRPEALVEWRGIAVADVAAPPASPEGRADLARALLARLDPSAAPGAGAGARVVGRGERFTPTGRRLAIVAGQAAGGDGPAAPPGRVAPVRPAEPEPPDPFFTGGVPASGAVLAGRAPLAPRPNPFRRGETVVDGIDIGAAFGDLLDVLSSSEG